MEVSEIGTKLTESTLALHLQNLDVEPLTPAWIRDHLGLRTDEQRTALNSPENDDLLAALYDRKRSDWQGKIVRMGADGEVDEIAMPPASALTPEQQADFLGEGELAYADIFAYWQLPRRDFIVPFSGTLLGQMCGLTRGESASYATVSAEPFVFPQAALTELVDRVEALRKAIAARERRWRDNAKSLAAYRRVDGMLQLLERAYHHAAKRPHDREQAELRAEQVAELRATLDGAFARVMKTAIGDEEALADALLEAMDNSDLADAAEKIAFDPLSVDADVAEELVDTVRYACEHLAKSVRADVLLREHVWPAVGVAAANAPYGFDVLLDEVNSPELRAELEDGWAKTYEEIRAHLGAAKQEGLVAKLAKAGKYYRAGPSVISNALNEGMLLLVWDGLAGEGKSRGSRLAALALRYIASMGIPGTKHAELMVGGRLDIGKMFRAFSELDGADTVEALEKRADFIKDLKLKDQFARIPGLQGLSILAYTAAIWSVASNDQMDAWQRGFTIASAAVGAAESLAHVGIAVKAYRDELEALEMTKPLANTIGRMSVMLGMVASGFAWHNDGKFSDALSFAGGALRVEGYIFSALAENCKTGLGEHLLAVRIAAGWFAFAGTLLGVAALAWSLIPPIEAADVGVASLLPPSFELMLDPVGAFAPMDAELRKALAKVPQRTLNVELAVVAGLFTAEERTGTAGAWLDEAPPTYRAAHMFGLVAPEIATLFGVDEDEVVGVGIPRTFRGPRRPKGI